MTCGTGKYHNQLSMDVQGVFLSTNSSMNVQDVPPSLNAGMLDCPASGQSGIAEWTKMWMQETVRYRNKETQSGSVMLRYRTEIQDAGMPMPAASTST